MVAFATFTRFDQSSNETKEYLLQVQLIVSFQRGGDGKTRIRMMNGDTWQVDQNLAECNAIVLKAGLMSP